MRRVFLNVFVCGCLAATAQAQQCAAPAPQCAAPPTAAPAPPPTSAGRFVRGPTPGAAAGESHSFGIRGPALHIPEIRLALPTLELPSLFHIRRDAEKIFDVTRSPFVEEQPLEFGNVPTSAPAPAAAPAPPTMCVPMQAPACAAPCVGANDEVLKALLERLARLEALEQELAALRAQNAATASVQADTRSVEAPTKPEASAPLSGSRPVAKKSEPARSQPRLQQASFEEVDEPAAAPAVRPSQPVTLRGTGLSAPPPPNRSRSQFGDWTRQR